MDKFLEVFKSFKAYKNIFILSEAQYVLAFLGSNFCDNGKKRIISEAQNLPQIFYFNIIKLLLKISYARIFASCYNTQT